MEDLLWKLDDIVRFARHPELPLRRWAVERLIGRFADQAGVPLLTMVDDPDPYISLKSTHFLAGSGDRERYGAPLLERLQTADEAHFGLLAQALARLDERAALPLILDRLGPALKGAGGMDEWLHLVDALGTFGGEAARLTLWRILDQFSRGDFPSGLVIDALLDAALPEDIGPLVGKVRSMTAGSDDRGLLLELSKLAGARRLAGEVFPGIEGGLDVALDRAESWLGRSPLLSDDCLNLLNRAFGQGYRGVPGILLGEAFRLVESRDDDVAGWRDAWERGERPDGYRLQAVYTLLLLEALGAGAGKTLRHRQRESAVALAAVATLSVNSDDEARLGAAQDLPETLLSILAEDREHVLPGIIERVAGLGPAVVPRLVGMLDPDDGGWGPIRALRALERLARQAPGSCDAAAPAMVEMIHDEQGDFACEAATDALAAIGQAAVGPMAAHLWDDDLSRQIYLAGALREIPTDDAARAILDGLPEGEPIDEWWIAALEGIGSPSAIEPLYAEWQADGGEDSDLAQALLVLCELNGVQRPELSEWQEMVEARDLFDTERLRALVSPEAARLAAAYEPSAVPADPGPAVQSKQRPARKPKTLSKKEKKKRAAQRKGQKRRKKK